MSEEVNHSPKRFIQKLFFFNIPFMNVRVKKNSWHIFLETTFYEANCICHSIGTSVNLF